MPPPPPENILPIVHAIRILHKNLYVIGLKLSKRDKLGIHSEIEASCLNTLSLSIESCFCVGQKKVQSLENMRVKISVLKNLIRTEQELNIIQEKQYLNISEQLVAISKMTSGWLKFITQKGARQPL